MKFCEPINLGEFLDRGQKLRESARELTAQCEQAVQGGIDELNATKSSAGTQLVAEPQIPHVAS